MAKSLFLAVLALCSFVLASCEPVNFEDCGSQMSALKEVDVTPCPNQPCQLKTGSNTTVEVKFIPKETITKATTVVYGIIGGEKLPYPGIQPDACNDQGITCPMKPDTEYIFKAVLQVKPIYPKVKLLVEWELKDQNDKMVYCFEMSVQIV